jgi:subtilisin-like proprotein convertase family protein
MKKMNYFLVFFLLTISVQIYSQDNKEKIIGSWVLKEIRHSDGTVNVKVGYLKYTFTNENKLLASTFLLDKGRELNYSIHETNLKTNFISYEILELSDKLVLHEKGTPYTNVFIKPSKPENYKDSLFSLSYEPIFIEFNRAHIPFVTYGTSDKNMKDWNFPTFDSSDGFGKFFIDNLMFSNKYFKDKNVRSIKVSFIVKDSGEITEITVVDELNDEWIEKKFIKLFSSKKNKWIPISLNGINYSSKLNFEFLLKKL